MPLLGTRGAASAMGFGLFGAVGPTPTYWIGLLGAAGSAENGSSVAVDSSSNVYVCGANAGGGNFEFAKYNSVGVIQWQRSLGGSGTSYGRAIATDASGNVYVAGNSDINASATNNYQIAKYNSTSTLQWQYSLGASNEERVYGIAVDASSNVYLCGYIFDGTSVDNGIVKLNSSGTLQWQRRLGSSGSDDAGFGIAVDASGNVYTCGYTTAPGSNAFLLAKYNSSGTIQWQRRLWGSSGNQSTGQSVAVDNSGNAYVCGYSTAAGNNDIQLAKYDTSGTLQWQRRLSSSSADLGMSVALDSSANVYLVGYSNTSGANNYQIAKYNSSGAIQWQRSLGGSASADRGLGITVDSAGGVCVNGYSNVGGDDDFLFARLPSDGSKTGTYTVGGYSIDYSASSLTDAASSLTSATTSLTDSTGGLAQASSSLTSSTSSYTSSVTTI